MPARKILRSIHEGARDLARDLVVVDSCLNITPRAEEDAVCAPETHPETRSSRYSSTGLPEGSRNYGIWSVPLSGAIGRAEHRSCDRELEIRW
jgi:hypothetical protein